MLFVILIKAEGYWKYNNTNDYTYSTSVKCINFVVSGKFWRCISSCWSLLTWLETGLERRVRSWREISLLRGVSLSPRGLVIQLLVHFGSESVLTGRGAVTGPGKVSIYVNLCCWNLMQIPQVPMQVGMRRLSCVGCCFDVCISCWCWVLGVRAQKNIGWSFLK